MSTQVKHTSYTKKNGYVWRQRYAGSTTAITLKTKDEKEAAQRSGGTSIRFMQLEMLNVPFQSMRESLKAYRDELVRMAKIAFLNLMMNPTHQIRGVETVDSSSAGNSAAFSKKHIGN
ncbi:hypothetical protein KIV35_22040 [Enterobacter roggenkampii]|uniref:hypothetical protein n=1 Tax=Enterobacter roggenkampii TaxID=1812935 RepID=UPI000F82C21A|nr:hypothetical protein [Enterobacter roggenkampii]MBS7802637.1 hypothetical protein [Enterobacter roggenkampii]MCK7119546.1 hypothetical protein [Enterobacter roggenkampii]MDK9941057.1 hypothetical protein [Enterobacter roggenkampii]MDK9945430.1 hypothetical protein [Enterobacter roggenkampii]RTP15875.1 hypothetical protein EKN52_20915 [Enterobacter roggenkampii]